MPKKLLKKGTPLYHGTRWVATTPKWWGIGKFPNKVGEDGGVSFTLDCDATPKVKNAQMILEYELLQDVEAIECDTKAQFYDILRSNGAAVCYTKQEQEVVIGLDYLPVYLQFSEEWMGF
jgi:hypothetical protein